MRKNRDLNLIAVVFLTALLFFAGCPQQPKIKYPPAPNNTSVTEVNLTGITPPPVNYTPPVTGCTSLATQTEVDDCFYGEGAQGRAESCTRIQSSVLKDDCFVQNARIQANQTYCQFIQNQQKIEICNSMFAPPPCIHEDSDDSRALCLAKAENNVSRCFEAGSAYSCITQFAEATSNILPCRSLSNEVERYSCEAIVMNEISRCNAMKLGPQQYACMQNYAVYKQDKFMCANIAYLDYKESCLAAVAASTGDYTACMQIQLEGNRDSCLRTAAVKSLDPSACDAMKSNFVKKVGVDLCYLDIARITSSPNLCGYSINDYYRDKCYAEIIAGGHYNFTELGCKSIRPEDYTWKDQCFYQLAMRSNDKTHCSKITDPNLQMECQG